MQITPQTDPPDRRLIERLIGFLRPKPDDVSPIEPMTDTKLPPPPTHYIERPTDPVRPDRTRLKRAALGRSDLMNPYLFPEGSLLLMRCAGHKVLMENMHRDILMGREAVHTRPLLPVRRIDLTYYAGYRSGMSRVHALLRRTPNHRIQLVDLDSTNGTYLNRTRLTPFVPVYIADGDEIQLGQFAARVYFIYP